MYPFGFTLTTEYRLWRNALYIRQAVHAHRANAEAMPFSIGNHITFRIPLLPGDDPLQTVISTPATEQVITDESGRPTGRIVTVSYVRPRLLSSFKPLTPISLSGYAAGRNGCGWRIAPALGSSWRTPKTGGRRGTPVLFNLWGDPAHGYFATEPWVGKQDSLVTGDGTIALQPGGTFHWMIAVRLAGTATPSTASRAAASAPTCLQ